MSNIDPMPNITLTGNTNDVLNWQKEPSTGYLVLSNGQIIKGKGLGALGTRVGELCFNTSITGYQEILTDPSYLGQIVTFTFPHIGNVGVNSYDTEDYSNKIDINTKTGALGAIFKCDITEPANYRSINHFNNWLIERNIVAISGIDTRALTQYIRKSGTLNAVITHTESSDINFDELKQTAASWSGLENLDLALKASVKGNNSWQESKWDWQHQNYDQLNNDLIENGHIVVIDYGIKQNILRLLKSLGMKITVVNAQTSAEQILALKPDGIFLSNGPGDPAAMQNYAIPTIQALIQSDIPIFGICLGHQLLALSVGGKTIKMQQGHRGANHPVKNVQTGKVEIVSMNHGFTVDKNSLPQEVYETHLSLFDQTNCGLAFTNKDIFSVQYHPESSPGPQDSYHLFDKFKQNVIKHKQLNSAS